jgi:hypothetical protein
MSNKTDLTRRTGQILYIAYQPQFSASFIQKVKDSVTPSMSDPDIGSTGQYQLDSISDSLDINNLEGDDIALFRHLERTKIDYLEF